MRKIQTGDKVIVIAGKDKGTRSTVTAISGDRVIVKGVNMIKKGVQGEGLIEKEAPIHISNIALYDAKTKSGSRVGIKEEKGKKVRYLKKSGENVLQG